MTRKIGVGLVGFGRIAEEVHLPSLLRHPGFKPAVVCDTTEARRAKAAALTGARTVADLDSLLGDEEVDLVVIGTPSQHHYEAAMAAIAAGKDVVVEKPMALTSEHAGAMAEAARKAGVLLTVFQNRRWDRDFLAVRQAISEGMLGTVAIVESRVFLFGSVAGYSVPEFNTRWRLERRYGGGALYDWAPHLFDQILQLFPGPVHCPYAEMRSVLWSEEVDDYFRVLLTLPGGVTTHVEMSQIARAEYPRWVVVGDRGTLVVAKTFDGDAMVRTSAGELVLPAGKTDWGAYYDLLYESLTGSRLPVVDPMEALNVVRLMEDVRRMAGAPCLARNLCKSV